MAKAFTDLLPLASGPGNELQIALHSVNHYRFCVSPPVGESSPTLLTVMGWFTTFSLVHGARRLWGKNKSWLSLGFAKLFAPGELVVIFLICSEREGKKGPTVVMPPLGPPKCLMPLTAISFSWHSTIYKWQCLLWCKPCLNFDLFTLKCMFILFIYKWCHSVDLF